MPTCDISANSRTPESSSVICKHSGGTEFTAGQYCMNAEKTEIYKAEEGKCTKLEFTSNTYYVFDCTNVSVCTLTAGAPGGTNSLVYKYENNQLKQIMNNNSFLRDTKLIFCPKGTSFSTNGKCSFPSAAGVVFKNPNTDPSKTSLLLKIDDTSGTASPLTPSAGAYYLDGSSISDGSYKKLIYCSSATSCNSEARADGVYLDEYTKSGNTYTKVITCTGGSCSTAQSAAARILLNPAVSGRLENALIQCPENDDCTVINGVSGAYYVNGEPDSETNRLIKCDSSKCEKMSSFSVIGQYIDYSTKVAGKTTYSNMITCNESSCISSEIADNEAGNYIDAADPTKIISCVVSDDKAPCSSTAHGGTNEAPKYFVDASNTKNIITCNSSGCTSAPGSTLQGHAYVDGGDSKKIITFSSNEFASDGTAITELDNNTKKLYYIDGTNPKRIIVCTGAAGGGSCAAPIEPDLTSIKYFLQKDGTNPSAYTIACSSSGCISSKSKSLD